MLARMATIPRGQNPKITETIASTRYDRGGGPSLETRPYAGRHFITSHREEGLVSRLGWPLHRLGPHRG